MQRTKEQNLRFHTLIGKLHIDAEEKQQLVEEASNWRVSSSKDLTVQEMDGLINHLQTLVNRQEPESARLMRRKVCSLFHELGYEHKDGSLNLEYIDAWMKKYSVLHKSLNDYTPEELPRLLTQIENMLQKEYK